MDLIIGGLFQGKTKYINDTYDLNVQESKYFSKYENDEVVVLLNCHLLETDLDEYVASLGHEKKIIASTSVVGASIVPIEYSEREFRDFVGTQNKKLVSLSDNVYRVWNGLVEQIKGE